MPVRECPSFEKVAEVSEEGKRRYAESCRIQQEEHDAVRGKTVIQRHDKVIVVQNPPMPPLEREELDRVHALPYMRNYHPVYEKDGGVPGIEEVKFSVTHNRGCFGGCNFCALAFHQGRTVRSRSVQSVVEEAVARGMKSFHKDVIAKNLKKKVIRSYPFEGWYEQVSSMESYFQCSMDMLNEDARQDLFYNTERQIYTKIRNSAPAKYAKGATVKNSLIADGCVIEGTVENSILFRNVHVGKGTVVKNCVLLQDTCVGTDVTLNCVITDKDVVIKDDRTLSGHQTRPFFIGKGETV
jgi:hypothetical protein